jgi:hypothetical protein
MGNKDFEVGSEPWSNAMEKRLHAAIVSIQKFIKVTPDLIHTWRFLIGAVYALQYRIQMGTSDESNSPSSHLDFVKPTETLLKKILTGGKINLKWRAGFWYNAAVMRIDACYERIFRVMLSEDSNNKNLRNANAKELWNALQEKLKNEGFKNILPCGFQDSEWKKLRTEVNSLKHHYFGAPQAIRMKTERTLLALEELLRIINHDASRKLLLASIAEIRNKKRACNSK